MYKFQVKKELATINIAIGSNFERLCAMLKSLSVIYNHFYPYHHSLCPVRYTFNFIYGFLLV